MHNYNHKGIELNLPEAYEIENGYIVDPSKKQVSSNILVTKKINSYVFIAYQTSTMDWKESIVELHVIQDYKALKNFFKGKDVDIEDYKKLSYYLKSFIKANPKINILDISKFTTFIYEGKELKLPLGFFMIDDSLLTIGASLPYPLGIKEISSDLETGEVKYTVFFKAEFEVKTVVLSKDEITMKHKLKSSILSKLDFPLDSNNIDLIHY
jgi:hypothetical protein